ncbi:MAG: VOC family protein, partial [Acidimicrobiia bacterium]
DSLYQQAIQAGLTPEAPPRDAEWGERYFHLTDPDGHELSFATPLDP